MEIELENDALYELCVNGRKQNPKYSKLPDTAVKGYVKAVNKLQLYKTINDVWREVTLRENKKC